MNLHGAPLGRALAVAGLLAGLAGLGLAAGRIGDRIPGPVPARVLQVIVR